MVVMYNVYQKSLNLKLWNEDTSECFVTQILSQLKKKKKI